MSVVPPWAYGPFELLVHAEGHLRRGDDFDRRIALISFDNAVEVAITTYLSLNPLLRGNRSYPKADVDKWQINYHTKLDFFEFECAQRKITLKIARTHIIWAHDHRNQQYHGGNTGTPEKRVLSNIREAALWIFSVLFDVADVEAVLEAELRAHEPPLPAVPDGQLDALIDQRYGLVEIADQLYYASEVLFNVDPDGYRDIGARLRDGSGDPTNPSDTSSA